MSGRLGDIHRRLRADNVPCVLEYRPGLGTVVLAGIDREHPTSRSAVLLHEAGGQCWIRQGGETFRLPRDADDEVVVNSVKLRVVHGWAEQGDRDAAAVLAKVHEMVPQRPAQPAAAEFPDPFALAFQMFDTAFRFGWTMTVPSPWGMFRTSFTVR
ncbi:MAG TPA: hypothetical protein VIU11_08600 [Nakamurella sp.]